MTIIDGHSHLWSHDMTHYPDLAWREDRASHLPKEDGRAARLVELVDAAGVADALNVQVPASREEFRTVDRQQPIGTLLRQGVHDA